jgi:hypothetical protein
MDEEAKFQIIIRGRQGCGKSTFVHQHLIPAIREAGLGAKFYDDRSDTEPSMTLSGSPFVDVLEDNDVD